MAPTKESLDRALEKVFRENNLQLFISALAVTGCPNRAEDAVQEAFYRLFRMQRKPRCLKAYVFRTVRNAAIDQLQQDVPNDATDGGIFELESKEDPVDSLARDEFQRKVAAAMGTLSEDERETVVGHLYADLTFREIARIRETSINTVWSWYRRGMEKLRGQLGEKL